MRIVDFSKCEKNERLYHGASGNKIGITYEDENYLLKFPKNLMEAGINANKSYSNSPVSEYLGSHIYDILGFSVHETLLGIRNGKLVVACKDFCKEHEKLYEFADIKTTSEDPYKDSEGKITYGQGTDLKETLEVIETHDILKDIQGVKEHFWNMFVVDALIGNTDRNNQNWGLLVHDNGKKELAPVYDNGNSFHSNWNLDDLANNLKSEEEFKNLAYKNRVCIFTLKNKRKPLQYEAFNKRFTGGIQRYKNCFSNPKEFLCWLDNYQIERNIRTNI